MKALIFAAGFGERMRPLTLHTPKPLLLVRGKPLIAWHIEALTRAGVVELVINLSHLGEQIKAALGDGKRFGAAIHYSEEGPVPLETGGGMKRALQYLGPDAFIALNGDVYTDFNYAPLCTAAISKAHAHLVLVPNPSHHPGGDFALYGDKVASCGPIKLTFSGIGLYQPKLLTGTPDGAFRLAPVLREAMNFGHITGQIHTGQWTDVGTPERLAELNL
jgi:N-acetyl-alpha-D-muramate 1-phosphate uridylyltransferase